MVSSRPQSVRFVVATLLAAAAAPTLVFAQSTGTTAVEGELTEVVISGARTINTIGTLVEQNVPRARSTITSEYLETQQAGASIFSSLNQIPGVSYTSNDPYGSSGGNLRIRGFEGSRISATFDGMPINDSGNYALFTNQILDPELVDRIDVNLGTTDVDSPTASATGGTVAFRSRTPRDQFGGDLALSYGEFDYKRYYASVDSGTFGPWGTKAFVTTSQTTYDKFKGPGDLRKNQYNAKLYQSLNDAGDFVSLAATWTRTRSYFYRNASAATFRQFGWDYDYLASCTRDAPTAGVADNDNATIVATTPARPAADNPANPTSCSNYWAVRQNPSNTGNVRAQSLFHLGDSFILTIDPSFQYTLANGGGTNQISETPGGASSPAVDRRIIGASNVPGIDLNGDGDRLDTVRFAALNNTNTRRYGLTSSLIWQINDDNRVRAAYTLDYARHRQTGDWGYLDANGNPESVFAGRGARKVVTADGSNVRQRDRFSIAMLNQLAFEWRGEFLDDRLISTVGVRAPFFERQLNQYCYTVDGGNGSNNSAGAVNNALCTTQPVAQALPNGNVRFTGAQTQFIPPYQEDIKFDDVLPNVGFVYKLTPEHSLYASYAETLSAPRTDNLYPVRRLANGTIGRGIPESETSKSVDFGWRYNTPTVLTAASLYFIDYSNRIVSAYDADLDLNVDRNVGKVKIKGVDLQAGFKMTEFVTVSAAASYNDSEIQVPAGAPAAQLPLDGKQLVETPEWTYSARIEITPVTEFRMGLQGKYLSKRFGTDNNDEYAPAYAVWDFDAAYELPPFSFVQQASLRFNMNNIFDKRYFGSISSGTGGSSVAFYNVGAPRTAMGTIALKF